eukprot:m.338555 g.338555  ORF g.338555 m.338555 type:complete len:329 (-) comp18460_c0_seq1:702-1688(-)
MDAVFMEGWLEKKSNKWRKHYAIIRGDKMFFFKSNKTNIQDELQGSIDIVSENAAQIGESKKKNYQFFLMGNSGRYTLKVPTEELRTQWMQAIKQSGAVALRSSSGDAPAVPGGHPSSGQMPRTVSGSSMGGQPPLPPGHPSGSVPPLPGGHPSIGGAPTGRALPPPPVAAAPPPEPVEQGPPPYRVLPPDPTDEFSEQPWHFGALPRGMAEIILQRHGSEGSFLIRASESSKGDYSLSVMDQKSPKHYKVHSAGNRLHLSGCSDQSFANLQALVDYYKSASKGRTNFLDKFAVETMDAAFSAPAIVRPGLMLPGQLIAMETEQQYRR